MQASSANPVWRKEKTIFGHWAPNMSDGIGSSKIKFKGVSAIGGNKEINLLDHIESTAPFEKTYKTTSGSTT